MKFNIKVTAYKETGTATITLYNDAIGLNEDSENKQKDKRIIEQPYDIEPFGNTKIYNIIPDEIEEFNKKQLSLQKSVARTKRMIHQLMRSMRWEYFITLTFDNATTDRTDYNLCCKRARVWFQNQRRIDKADKLAFICIPELHSDMESWHMHAVISNIGNMALKDSNRKTTDGRTIFNLSGWNWGFSTAIPIDNADPCSSIKLSKYVTKYMTKESFVLAKSRHRYFASNNIPKPIVEKYYCENQDSKNDMVRNILNDKNYEIVYTSRFSNDYTDIQYIEVVYNDSS